MSESTEVSDDERDGRPDETTPRSPPKIRQRAVSFEGVKDRAGAAGSGPEHSAQRTPSEAGRAVGGDAGLPVGGHFRNNELVISAAGVEDDAGERTAAGGKTRRSASQLERIRHLRIPGNSSFRRLAHQVSGRRKYRHGDDGDSGNAKKRPKHFFDLSLVTLCCCFSPLGVVAILMSVLSDANYKAGHEKKSRKYGYLALFFSIIGITSSIAIAITLLLLFRYPWDQTSRP